MGNLVVIIFQLLVVLRQIVVADKGNMGQSRGHNILCFRVLRQIVHEIVASSRLQEVRDALLGRDSFCGWGEVGSNC